MSTLIDKSAPHKTPLISIVLPTYKVEHYVDDALQSVMNQTYRNWEVVAVDDGSPDRCGMILDNWARVDCRIRVVHQRNRGVSAARNRGAGYVTGDFVSYLDPDDALVSDFLRIIADSAGEYGADLIIFQISYVSSELDFSIHPAEPSCASVYTTNLDYLRYFWGTQFAYTSSACGKAWRRQTFEDFTFRDGVRLIGEDTLFCMRTSVVPTCVVNYAYPGYRYRQHSASMMHRSHLQPSIQGWYERIKAVLELYRHAPHPNALIPLFGFSTYLFRWGRHIISHRRIPINMQFPAYFVHYLEGDTHCGLWLHIKIATMLRWAIVYAIFLCVGLAARITYFRCKIKT